LILPKHNLKPLIIFTIGYTAASAVVATLTGNTEFIFYLVVMLVLIALTLFVYRRVAFPISALWGLSVWGLLHMMGGMMPVPEVWQTNDPINVLYSFWLIPGWLKYDQVIHAYGFGIATWICWECLRFIVRENNNGHDLQPTSGTLILCLCAGMGLGAFNEVVEFFATLVIPDTNVGDYANTGWDLVFNLIGGIIAITIIRGVHHKNTPDFLRYQR